MNARPNIPGIAATGDKAIAEAAALFAHVSPNTLEMYRRMLENHDWSFEWSDDSRRVAAGRASLERLSNMQRKFDPDFVTWNALAPECCHRGASHKAATLAAMSALIDAADKSLDYSPELRRAIANAYTAWVQAGGERL